MTVLQKTFKSKMPRELRARRPVNYNPLQRPGLSQATVYRRRARQRQNMEQEVLRPRQAAQTRNPQGNEVVLQPQRLMSEFYSPIINPPPTVSVKKYFFNQILNFLVVFCSGYSGFGSPFPFDLYPACGALIFDKMKDAKQNGLNISDFFIPYNIHIAAQSWRTQFNRNRTEKVPLYIPIVPLIENSSRNPSFLLQKNPDLSDEIFELATTSMRQEGKLLCSELDVRKCLQFFLPNPPTLEQIRNCDFLIDQTLFYNETMAKIIKMLGKLYICADCALGFSTHDKAIAHLRNAHKDFLDPIEEAERVNILIRLNNHRCAKVAFKFFETRESRMLAHGPGCACQVCTPTEETFRTLFDSQIN